MKEDLQKHTLNLRKGDFDYIDLAFRSRALPASEVIRRVVSKLVDTMKRGEEEELPNTEGEL